MDATFKFDQPDGIPIRLVLPFFVLTFGIAWGVFGAFFLAPTVLSNLFGEVSAANPLFVLAVYSPAIAALLLVARHGGRTGMTGFLSRILLWRASLRWWLFLLLAFFQFQLNNPLWPDAQPWDTVLLVLAAMGLVWVQRDRMFDISAGHKAVIGWPP
ncbi:MAG: hypothetical protein AAGE03_18320 [Pseudomonadota bacterium]